MSITEVAISQWLQKTDTDLVSSVTDADILLYLDGRPQGHSSILFSLPRASLLLGLLFLEGQWSPIPVHISQMPHRNAQSANMLGIARWKFSHVDRGTKKGIRVTGLSQLSVWSLYWL